MDSNRQIQTVSNGLFLVAGGAAVLLFRTLFLNWGVRIILAGAAAVWGVYLLIKNPENKTPGLVSLGASAALILFGGILKGLASVAGVGLIIAGGISWVSSWFKKRQQT